MQHTGDGAELARRRLRESIRVSERMLRGPCLDQVREVAESVTTALREGNKVIFFGNGGSAMDAGHLAAELLGRFQAHRRPLPAMSLPDQTAAMTAIANDYSYAEVFARQLDGLGRPGDVVVGLTTSGNSRNVTRALRLARDGGMVSVAFTGEDGGEAKAASHICVQVPSDDTARVQEAMMHLGHTLCELVESSFLAPAGEVTP